MKAVMLSIRPKWVEKIAGGEKTVEVRKTRPSIETPFKCYIYCTKAVGHYWSACCCQIREDDLWKNDTGKVEFNDGFEYWGHGVIDKCNYLNGKVVGEFICDRIDKYPYRSEFGYEISEEDFNATMLTANEFCGYGNQKTLYGWHISDLKIYDKPKELGEFKRTCPIKNQFAENCNACPYSYYERNQVVPSCSAYLKRPPQSWCCVEEL